MTSKLFDDVIISATELKMNQKRWFDKAKKSPVSITNRGGRQFVLINRDQIHNLVTARDYAEKVIKYCQEIKDAPEAGRFTSAVFPWAKHLSQEERLAFRDELVATFTEQITTDDWSALEEVISSWQATAEALTNSQFMEVVEAKKVDNTY